MNLRPKSDFLFAIRILYIHFFLFSTLPNCVILMFMSNFNNQTEGFGSGIAEDTTFELPPERKVVFYNDNYTTMDFVVDVLVSIFNKTHEEAENLMQIVHEEGSSVVGVYTFDIAVSRANLTKQIARKNGFPLRVEVE